MSTGQNVKHRVSANNLVKGKNSAALEERLRLNGERLTGEKTGGKRARQGCRLTARLRTQETEEVGGSTRAGGAELKVSESGCYMWCQVEHVQLEGNDHSWRTPYATLLPGYLPKASKEQASIHPSSRDNKLYAGQREQTGMINAWFISMLHLSAFLRYRLPALEGRCRGIGGVDPERWLKVRLNRGLYP